MQNTCSKLGRTAAMVVVLLAACVGSAWGQYAGGVSTEVGDIFVCFGNGTCNVMRNTSGTTLTLLDQISDNPSSGTAVTNPGNTFGGWIDNTLHFRMTDDGGPNTVTNTSGSNIVEFTIASVNALQTQPKAPPLLPISHIPLTVFNGGGTHLRGLSLDKHGNMFVGNANNPPATPATIVELGPTGTFVNSFTIPAVTTPAWSAGKCYPDPTCPDFSPNATVTQIIDTNGHVQQELTPGTAGISHPAWNDAGGTTNNNVVIWKDLGKPIRWFGGHLYTQGQLTIGAGHVQQETAILTPCTSQVFPNALMTPTWSISGGTIVDGTCNWTDLGVAGVWAANTPYVTNNNPYTGQLVTDPSGDVQQVQIGGTSGESATATPLQPFTGWNEGGITIDGLTWNDEGLPTFGSSCVGNQIKSLDIGVGDNPTVYFTSGPGGIVEAVPSSFAPNSCTIVVDFGPNVILSGIRVIPSQSVPNCKSDPNVMNSCPIYSSGGILVVATGTQDIDIGDTTDPDEGVEEVEQVTDICTGSSTNVQLGGDTQNTCALLLDLNGNIKVRYPLASVSTLQALALDPFIADCTSTTCSNSASIPSATVANFWVGDSASSKFYSFDFATGTQTPFDANLLCPTQAIPFPSPDQPAPQLPPCPTPPDTGRIAPVNNVQSIAIYGARGANQPVLAKVFTSPSTSNTEVFFLQNKLITTIYNTSAQQVAYPLTLWASLVSNNSDVALPPDTSTDGGVPCQPTTLSAPNTIDTHDCIIWKFDVALNNTAGDFVSTVFGAPAISPPNVPQTIDLKTSIFTDMAYDTTTLFGNLDPSDSRVSVHSLHEVTPQPISGSDTSGGNCTYGSPVPKCFQNGSNIQFKFTCADPKLAGAELGTLSPAPFLLIDQTFPNVTAQSPLECGRTSTCTFSATNGSENYRFDAIKNQWVFGWQVPPPPNPNTTRYFTGCTTQPQLSPFCVSFFVSSKCSANPTVTSVSPSSGSSTGGTSVTITGSDFASGATVQFQGVTVLATVVSSTKITLTTQPCSSLNIGPCPRPTNVTVTNPPGPTQGGLNGTLVNGFTYQ